ncbi:hypothetical protein QT397_21080 [Microbulbifer sp. MKSA007]|nr:hypothetical protein QT397_21080 [Microbulbifer sp. MKSA007]
MFLTLEDETGCINVVIYEAYQTLYRAEIIHGGILIVHGELQVSKGANNNSYKTTHVIAKRISSISEKNHQKTRNFH